MHEHVYILISCVTSDKGESFGSFFRRWDTEPSLETPSRKMPWANSLGLHETDSGKYCNWLHGHRLLKDEDMSPIWKSIENGVEHTVDWVKLPNFADFIRLLYEHFSNKLGYKPSKLILLVHFGGDITLIKAKKKRLEDYLCEHQLPEKIIVHPFSPNLTQDKWVLDSRGLNEVEDEATLIRELQTRLENCSYTSFFKLVNEKMESLIKIQFVNNKAGDDASIIRLKEKLDEINKGKF